MEKQEFSLKDVILGMKQEYERNESMLNLLKALTTTSDRSVKDFYYQLYKDRRIRINFIPSKMTPKGIVENIKKKIYHFGNETGTLKKDENGQYFIESERFHAFIEDKHIESFKKIADEILASDFANEENFDYYYTPRDKTDFTIFPNIIIYSNSRSKVNYDPRQSTIRINSFYLNPGMIEKLLNAKISSEFLTPYQKSTIKGSPLTKKRLIISPDTPFDNNETFRITEEENTVTLRKIKTRNKD